MLPDNEHDLTLFKLVKRKQISTLELENMDFPLLCFPNNMRLNIQSRKGGSKKFKSSV
jgi:hypothetical protein